MSDATNLGPRWRIVDPVGNDTGCYSGRADFDADDAWDVFGACYSDTSPCFRSCSESEGFKAERVVVVSEDDARDLERLRARVAELESAIREHCAHLCPKFLPYGRHAPECLADTTLEPEVRQ